MLPVQVNVELVPESAVDAHRNQPRFELLDGAHDHAAGVFILEVLAIEQVHGLDGVQVVEGCHTRQLG